MGAALTIFVLLSMSVLFTRIASVALRLTGLEESSARFQALSAFTGTGFTTIESEAIVNYPVRRKIIMLLMIIGNLGLISVFATLVVSLVHTEGAMDAVLEQLAWLLAGMAFVWFLILNPIADKALCAAIGQILQKTTVLGKRRFHRLLQLGNGLSICEHRVEDALLDEDGRVAAETLESLDLDVVAKRSADGVISRADANTPVRDAMFVVLYGGDSGHEALAQYERLCAKRNGDEDDQ